MNKDEITQILPHRGRMLLLDEVNFSPLNEFIGSFLVTQYVCAGHSIGGKLVMKGSDYLDMSAQILAVAVFFDPNYHNYLYGKMGFATKYGEAKFHKMVLPGETILIEIKKKIFILFRIRPELLFPVKSL